MAQIPVIDLHCDLLLYLSEDPHRTAWDNEARCSLSQLKQGGVQFQTFALFADEVADPFSRILQQVDLFVQQVAPHIQGAIALEGAEPLEENSFEEQLEAIQKIGGPLLYIGFTWNGENHFGGGAHTNIGLKEAGKKLLAYMARKGIALDFSHASDRLAEELLQQIDKEGYNLPLLASHSNFRAIQNVARNLPDWLAQEIIHRGGLIGLNLFAAFVGGEDGSWITRHADYGRSLGGASNLASGSDFFAPSPGLVSRFPPPHFFPRFANSSCYPDLFAILGPDIAHTNASHWLRRHEEDSVSLRNAEQAAET